MKVGRLQLKVYTRFGQLNYCLPTYTMPLYKTFLLLLSLVIALLLSTCTSVSQTNQTEILWDSWGVPHIYGKDAEGLFHAFGWAQMQSHGNIVLRLYGQARGRAAEYWGKTYLESDRYVRTMGIPTRAQEWYEAQSQQMRRYIDEFATGINEYVQQNGDQIDDEVEAVLPVDGVDVLAHMQQAIHFNFVLNPQQVASVSRNQPLAGSNSWAIAPSHSASDNAMLLANPHLPWSDIYHLYEAQLSAPGIDAYGTAVVGMPALAIAFNDHLGWTLTVNPFDGVDFYKLTLVDGGYRWNEGVRSLETETQILQVKQADGTLREEKLVVRRSIHGPIIAAQDGKATAVRVVGLDHPHLIQQFWSMAQATNLNQFEAALQRLQLPLFNILYADQNGQILYLFNAQVPKRSQGDWDYWQGIVPGDTSETLWRDYHPYSDLPRLLNPDSGWLQNANDPPWTSTFPRILNPSNYPTYLTPASLGETSNIFRPQRSIDMLNQDAPISFEAMIADKFSSHLELANRLWDDLIPAARQLGNELAGEAADVLEAWDKEANADSRGAVLFYLWAFSVEDSGLFATPWQESAPLTTPDGLGDLNCAVALLEEIAAQMRSRYGALDVPWGEVARLRYGNQDLPASGATGELGSFRVLNFAPAEEGNLRAVAGDAYIAAIEFAHPPRAQVLTVYGNATQPGSPHVGDQLPLYARGDLRPVWQTRKEIKAHLESRQVFPSTN